MKAANVEFIGEINDANKSEFLSGAIALLVPIDWPEPFGLVMIEAMACGTPVIAFNRGSVPEVIEDGVTGFIVEDINGAIGAVDRLHLLSRAKIRRRFEERFTARRMAQDYLSVYRSLSESEGLGPAPAVGHRRCAGIVAPPPSRLRRARPSGVSGISSHNTAEPGKRDGRQAGEGGRTAEVIG